MFNLKDYFLSDFLGIFGNLSNLIDSSYSLINNIDTMIYELVDLGYAFLGVIAIFFILLLILFFAQFIVITIVLLKINSKLKNIEKNAIMENKIETLKQNMLSN